MNRKLNQWYYLKLLLPIVVLIILVVCLGILPVFRQHNAGLENFAPEDSTLSLCQNLYPSRDFLECFPYIHGDYQYDYNGILLDSYAVAFSYLTYTPEQYVQAKQFCSQQFSNTDSHQYHIGDYHFIEHLCYTSKSEEGKYIPTCQYPECFNMFAYNDSLCTLLFLGYYEPNLDTETQMALSDFSTFFRKHFSRYYELEE